MSDRTIKGREIWKNDEGLYENEKWLEGIYFVWLWQIHISGKVAKEKVCSNYKWKEEPPPKQA